VHQGRPEAVTASPPPVVLVTGATGGIGAATVRAFARRGARLVLLARSPGRLEALRADVEAHGGTALVTVADVAAAGAVDAAFEAATARFGRVDVVIHAAAVVAYGRFDEVPAEVWDRVVAVNVVGTSNVARAALRRFREQDGGSLVLTGSILSQAVVPFMGAYVTTKWQNRALARLLQQEARQTPGIHVGILHPGAIRTPIYSLAANYAGRIGRPPPPVYPPERVADAILDVVDRRLRSRSVGITNPIIALGFTALPRVYDVLVVPMMKAVGLSRREVSAHAGNVFVPSEDVGVLPAEGDPADDLCRQSAIKRWICQHFGDRGCARGARGRARGRSRAEEVARRGG
jgi:NAD(P)-dependent dehydrogenase (short-subunit alcohol dehydrogenase family)